VKKIVVLVDKELPTDHSFIQGVLEKSIPKMDYEVTFVGYKSNLDELNLEGVKYITIEKPSLNFFLLKVHKIVKFKKIIENEGMFDILFSRNDPAFLILGWLLKRKKRVHSHFHQISHLHAFVTSEKSISYRIKRYGDLMIRKLFMNHVSGILLISEQMKRFLLDVWPEYANKYIIYPMGVDVSMFENNNKIEDRIYDVTYIGTLAKSRRIDLMVDAINSYNQKYGQLNFHIWGESTNHNDNIDIRKYVEKLNLVDKVHFHGKVSRSEISKILSQTKIGLSTIPISEIFKQISPTKLMEYLGAGCCVIANKGIDEQDCIVNAAFGEQELLDSFEPNLIADKLNQKLSNIEKMQQESDNGKAFIVSFRD
jgi:glycosyltransferase involved in cell wall biosynthesis